jgi:hypothetical protein
MNPRPILSTERLRTTYIALVALLNHERLSPNDNLAIERVLTIIATRWINARHHNQDLHP